MEWLNLPKNITSLDHMNAFFSWKIMWTLINRRIVLQNKMIEKLSKHTGQVYAAISG